MRRDSKCNLKDRKDKDGEGQSGESHRHRLWRAVQPACSQACARINVYCEIYSYRTPLDQIRKMNPKGIILTGGPNSVYEEGAATAPKELFELGVPVLGCAMALS